MLKQLDFFYFLGSTYSYLSVYRADECARREKVSLRWRPFSVRTIMREQDNVPFATKPVKLKYMWRDIERRAHRLGVPFRSPPPYPIDADELANRVATVAAGENWCPEFTKAAYSAWFMENEDPGEPGRLSAILERLGKDPVRTIEKANSQQIRERYAEETNVARAMGIFGSPTFACGTEIFWGDDRLPDAIEWLQSRLKGASAPLH